MATRCRHNGVRKPYYGCDERKPGRDGVLQATTSARAGIAADGGIEYSVHALPALATSSMNTPMRMNDSSHLESCFHS